MSTTPSPRHILIVDDDVRLLHLMVRDLQDTFVVHAASTIDDALPLLCARLFAVVSDHDLRDPRDGPWLLRQARIEAPGARRILISGRARPPDAADADLWHAMLEKPFPLRALRALLD